MAIITNLVVKMGADAKGLKKGLEEGKKSVTSFAKSASKTIAIGIGAAVTAATGAFALLSAGIRNTAEEIDVLAKTASSLGIMVKDLQALDFAAELSGVSFGQLNNALRKMTQGVGLAAQGTGIAKKALEELGISAEALNKLSPDKQFEAIAEAMKGIKNENDQVRLAMDLFGRDGARVLNLLRSDLEGAKKEFNELGFGISESQAKAVEAFNDSRARLSRIFEGMRQRITVAVAPALKELNDFLIKFIKDSGGLDVVAKNIASFMVTTAKAFISAIKVVAKIASRVSQIIKGIVADLRGALDRFKLLGRAISARSLDPGVIGTLDTIRREREQAVPDSSIDKLFDGISTALEKGLSNNDSFIEPFQGFQNETKKSTEAIKMMGDAAKKSGDTIAQLQKSMGKSELARILGDGDKAKDNRVKFQSAEFDRVVRQLVDRTRGGVKQGEELAVRGQVDRLNQLVKSAENLGQNTLAARGVIDEINNFIKNQGKDPVRVEIQVSADEGFTAKIVNSPELQKAMAQQVNQVARQEANRVRG